MTERSRTTVRRIVRAGATLLLLVLAWGALSGGIRQLSRALTTWQWIETVVQLMCGVLSLLVVLTAFRWRRWAGPVRAVWAATLVVAAGLSGLVWGPPMPFLALLFAAVALLVALGVHAALAN
jgi:peptidoglycan/LPS O-acetylase OafA/YrhL